MSPTVRQKLERLIELVGRRRQWQDVIDALRGMRDWVLTTEHILSGAWATSQEPLSNATVNQRLDQWCATLAQLQATGPLTEEQRRCLAHFLQITHNLRAHLVLCYDHPDFPRTNNDMEGYIRSIKTRYRRISGRKNWNSYLLRYGRSVAYYDCLQREGHAVFEARLQRVSHHQWQAARLHCRAQQRTQLQMWRFRHKREPYLRSLELRWTQTTSGTPSLH